MKINGQTEFSEIIHKDWLGKINCFIYTSYLTILKPIVAQSYKRVRIFTSDKEHFVTDGEIRNLRFEKIGDFNQGFYGLNNFIDFLDSSQNINDISQPDDLMTINNLDSGELSLVD